MMWPFWRTIISGKYDKNLNLLAVGLYRRHGARPGAVGHLQGINVVGGQDADGIFSGAGRRHGRADKARQGKRADNKERE